MKVRTILWYRKEEEIFSRDLLRCKNILSMYDSGGWYQYYLSISSFYTREEFVKHYLE